MWTIGLQTTLNTVVIILCSYKMSYWYKRDILKAILWAILTAGMVIYAGEFQIQSLIIKMQT